MLKRCVVIVDDDELSLRCLERWIDGPKVTATTIDGGLRAVARELPAVAIFDRRFSGDERTGTDAIRAVLAISPRSSVLIVTANVDRKDQARALRDGAEGYFSKADCPELAQAVRALLDTDEDEEEGGGGLALAAGAMH